MKQKLKLAIAFLCGSLFFGSISFAATELKARTTDYTIVYNGEKMKLDDPVVSIGGKSHIPFRGVFESLGYEVGFDNGVISLNDNSSNNEQNPASVESDGKGTNKLAAKYSVNGKLNGELMNKAIESKEITVNEQDKDTGESFFHVVIKENNYEAYKVIKAKGIDPNLKDKDGNTPLHIAVMLDSSFYFGELRNQLDVNVQYKNNEGKYPSDYAKKNSSYEISLKFTEKAE